MILGKENHERQAKYYPYTHIQLILHLGTQRRSRLVSQDTQEMEVCHRQLKGLGGIPKDS